MERAKLPRALWHRHDDALCTCRVKDENKVSDVVEECRKRRDPTSDEMLVEGMPRTDELHAWKSLESEPDNDTYAKECETMLN